MRPLVWQRDLIVYTDHREHIFCRKHLNPLEIHDDEYEALEPMGLLIVNGSETPGWSHGQAQFMF